MGPMKSNEVQKPISYWIVTVLLVSHPHSCQILFEVWKQVEIGVGSERALCHSLCHKYPSAKAACIVRRLIVPTRQKMITVARNAETEVSKLVPWKLLMAHVCWEPWPYSNHCKPILWSFSLSVFHFRVVTCLRGSTSTCLSCLAVRHLGNIASLHARSSMWHLQGCHSKPDQHIL